MEGSLTLLNKFFPHHTDSLMIPLLNHLKIVDVGFLISGYIRGRVVSERQIPTYHMSSLTNSSLAVNRSKQPLKDMDFSSGASSFTDE
uniref:Uncharacterized protein n=1 Tax=Romanomermis culicivorax TaxID=13658 RepID=A0A915IEK2_ROMCU